MKKLLLAAAVALLPLTAHADRVLPPAMLEALRQKVELLKPRFQAAETSCPARIDVLIDLFDSKEMRDVLTFAGDDPGFHTPLPPTRVILGGDYLNAMAGRKSAYDWSICKGDPATAKLALTAPERALFTRWSTEASKEALTITNRDTNDLPYFDVNRECRRMGTPGSGNYNWCRNEEQAAYNALNWMWPQLRSGKDRCIAMSMRFYQTLEQCASSTYAVQLENDKMRSSQPLQR